MDPLKQGLEFGMESNDERIDHRYRWYVDNEETNIFYKVGSIEKAVNRFTLLYRTNPDHEIVHFVPSIGIAKFIYVHHGTISEADVSLVEFHQK